MFNKNDFEKTFIYQNHKLNKFIPLTSNPNADKQEVLKRKLYYSGVDIIEDSI